MPKRAKYLKRYKTSIYRELSKRNEAGEYDYKYAQKLTSASMGRPCHQKTDKRVIRFIEEKIVNKQWSPEQISG